MGCVCIAILAQSWLSGFIETASKPPENPPSTPPTRIFLPYHQPPSLHHHLILSPLSNRTRCQSVTHTHSVTNKRKLKSDTIFTATLLPNPPNPLHPASVCAPRSAFFFCCSADFLKSSPVSLIIQMRGASSCFLPCYCLVGY